jgi:formylglycine-generating enzyme required for sulfatase activity
MNPPHDSTTSSPFAARTGKAAIKPPAPIPTPSAAPSASPPPPPAAVVSPPAPHPVPAAHPAPPTAAPTAAPQGGAGLLVVALALLTAAGAGVWWWTSRPTTPAAPAAQHADAPARAEPQATPPALPPPAPAEAPELRAARAAEEFEFLQQRATVLGLEPEARAAFAEATLLAAQAQARTRAGEHEAAAETWTRAVMGAGPLVFGRLGALHDSEAAGLREVRLEDQAAGPAQALAVALRAADEAARRGAWSEAVTHREEARALIGPASRAMAEKFADMGGGAAARGDLSLATLFYERALRLAPELAASREHLYRHKFAPGQRLAGPAGLELAYAPPAEFTRGSAEQEAGRDSDETPHRVTLSRGFFIAIDETTQRAWDEVFGPGSAAATLRAARARPEFISPELPMHSVTWEQAMEFCRRLSEKSGLAFRLPTEAEWEYACRAGTGTAFNLGVEGLSARDANIDDGTSAAPLAPRPPGTSGRANAWGLRDLHGNVWEWCADWSAPYPAGPDVLRDPAGPAQESLGRIDLAMKVVRGGGWNAPANDARSANRWEYAPAVATAYIGFRVVHDPDLTRP